MDLVQINEDLGETEQQKNNARESYLDLPRKYIFQYELFLCAKYHIINIFQIRKP